MAVGQVIRLSTRIGLRFGRRHSQQNQPSGRGFGTNTLRRPLPRQTLPGHNIAPFRRSPRPSSSPTAPSAPPQPPRPLTQPLPSQRTPLEQFNRGLIDFVYPGLNEVSDWLAERTLEAINDLVNLGEQQRPRPSNPNPDPTNNNNFNFPFNPAWRNMRGYAVAVFAYSAINIGGADWEIVSGMARNDSNYDSYAYYTYASIEGSGESIDVSLRYYGSPLDNGSMEHGYLVFVWSFIYTDYLNQIIANGGSLNIAFRPEEPFTLVNTYWVNLPDPLPQSEPESPDFPEIIILNPPEEEEVTCDLSPIQSILRMQQQQLSNLQTAVNNANLNISGNINSLKPPINRIDVATQAISNKTDDLINNLLNVKDIANATRTGVSNVATKVDDVAGAVNNVSSKADDLASSLNNVRDIARATENKVDDVGNAVRNTADKVDDVGNAVRNTADKVDDVGNAVRNTADKVDDVGRTLNNVGNRVNDIWNKIGENFTKTMERFDKLAKWLRLPLVFDALSLIVVLHNAAMLSSNVVQTLGQIIDTALDIMNLKGENEESFSVSEILGKQADQFMASIVGQETWTQTKVTWKRLSNIYQAAANVIYSVQSIVDSARSIMELGAEMTGKIGNALRAAGVVFENAFNWFPEQINAATARQNKLNGMIQGIQNIDDTASSLSSAVSEVKSIQDTVIEMREQRQKFNEAVNELVTGKTETETETKAKSQSPTIQSNN